MGFYLAEGSKKNDNRVAVSNSESDLVKKFLDFIKEYFGVPEETFYLYVKLDDVNKCTPAIKFWPDKLGLGESQIRTTVPDVRPPKAKYGNGELVVYNTCFSHLFMALFNNIISMDLNRNDATYLVRGLEAGDGYVMEHGGIETGIVSDIKYSSIILRHCLRNDILYMNMADGKTTARRMAEKAGVTFRAANLMVARLEKEDILSSMSIFASSRKISRTYKSRVFRLTDKGKDMLKYLQIN